MTRQEGSTTEARTPERVDELFAERLNGGDLAGLVALYEPGASLVMQEGPIATGHAAIREGLAGFLAMKPQIRMRVVQTVRVGDDLAVLYDDWRMAASAPDGAAIELSGKALEIVRRQPDGSWRFILDDPFARG